MTLALVEAAKASPESLLKRFETSWDGLAESQANVLRERVGLNEVQHEKPLPWWQRLWMSYRNLFSLLLTLLAIVSYLTEDIKATVVIASMVVLATLLRFWQEGKAAKAADVLKAMVSNTATVFRRDASVDRKTKSGQGRTTAFQRIEVSIRLVVPGDLISLSAGDMIPGDCRVLVAKDLFVSQSALTGESMPVEKFSVLRDRGVVNPLELDNILFMGTNVVSGSATALVVTTGDRTYFGALASRVTAIDRAPTSFETGVNNVSWLLMRFMVVMVPVVFLINALTKESWLEALLLRFPSL